MRQAQEHQGSEPLVALAGGVGGAKLAHGLALAWPERPLSVVVNTGDDFSLFGLHISPDLDTVMYTLSGLANPETGWGIQGDTFETLGMIERYGGDVWFKLGDRDFATHVLRSQALRKGETLSQVTSRLARAMGVAAALLPMSDQPIATLVQTPDGLLDFQDYFVRRHQQDDVIGITLRGIEEAQPAPGVPAALADAVVIVLCPSNPIVSIGPILAVPGLRDALVASHAPIVAVSPIVGGQALKGPADRMLATLGHEVSAAGVAALYADLIDGIVIDELDAALAPRIEELGVAVEVAPTIMRDESDRRELARRTVRFAESLRR